MKRKKTTEFTYSDIDRLIEWAKVLSSRPDCFYNKMDAALALKLRIIRSDMVSDRYYAKKTLQS
jgi:hypothetical protein